MSNRRGAVVLGTLASWLSISVFHALLRAVPLGNAGPARHAGLPEGLYALSLAIGEFLGGIILALVVRAVSGRIWDAFYSVVASLAVCGLAMGMATTAPLRGIQQGGALWLPAVLSLLRMGSGLSLGIVAVAAAFRPRTGTPPEDTPKDGPHEAETDDPA